MTQVLPELKVMTVSCFFLLEILTNLLLLLFVQSGLPAYGLGSIDPYFYRRGIFRYAKDGIQGGLLIKNMQIHGISNMKINSFNGNFTGDSLIVKLGLECQQLKADGQFKADVKFGGLRLVPKGPFNITIGELLINGKWSFG